MTIDNASSTGTADDLLLETEAHSQSDSSRAAPSKYEGKSVEDLIKMHQNAEKLISRQGGEVAQLRRMADQLLDLKKSTTEHKTVERTPVTVEALLNDPEKALNSAVTNSDAYRRAEAAEAKVARMEAKLTERDFVSSHPSFKDDMDNPEFTAWVSKNPLRQALGNEAAKSNFEAAKNLWDMWDEHKELIGSRKTTEGKTTARKVPSTIKATPTENHAERTFSRAKLIELRMKVADGDPAATTRWNDPAFQEAMHRAYADGRVK